MMTLGQMVMEDLVQRLGRASSLQTEGRVIPALEDIPMTEETKKRVKIWGLTFSLVEVAPHSLKVTADTEEDTEEETSCCIMDLDLSSVFVMADLTVAGTQFGGTSEHLKTFRSPRHHLAANLDICLHGIYV